MGVAVLRGSGDATRVLLLRRARGVFAGAWTIVMGGVDRKERASDTARREVLEETGFICRLLRFVGHTDYIDRKGRPKVVAYWVMSAVAGTFVPNEEVDELRWVDVAAAGGLLSYERDRELLAVVAADDQLEPLI